MMNFWQYSYPTGVLAVGLAVWMGGCVPFTVFPSSESVSPDPALESTLPQPSQSADSVPSDRAPTEGSPSPAAESEPGQQLPISAEAEIGGQVIQLEVARTPQEQAKGLMHRPPLPDDRGMLFPFNPPRPVQFWMKNTPSPLDMVFLENGEVQAIAAAVPPCEADPCPTYGPETPVPIDQVLELRSGRAAELGLQVGDRVNVQFLN